MADINVQRKNRSIWPWLVTLLLIVVVAAGVWWYLGANREAADPDPATELGGPGQETNPAPYDPGTAPQYPATGSGLPADTTP